jgi:AAA15 family ATPase/GTPase
MKVLIQNLGILKKAEIELKPLTIFVGPNNTGKSWTAYTMSSVLGHYGWREYQGHHLQSEDYKAYPPLDKAFKQILDEGNARVNVIEFLEKYGDKYLCKVGNLAGNWMAKFLGSESTTFENLKVKIDLAERKKDCLQNVRKTEISAKLSLGKEKKSPLLYAIKEKNSSEAYYYTEGDILDKLPPRAVREILFATTFTALHRSLYNTICIMPTERTLLVTLPISKFVKENGPVTELHLDTGKDDKGVTKLMYPLASFIDLMKRAFNISLSHRLREAQRNPAIKKYVNLSEIMEKRILGGSLDFSTSEPDVSRKILFHPAKGVALDIPIVSSMVKELSPIVLYLRYLALEGDWLIIDEPEMNLHPEAQTKLIEVLAMLVNAGIHVLITSHTPYMVDHLVNLVTAARHQDQESVRRKLFLKRKDAFIDRERVAVYLFGNRTARNILKKDGLIDWRTFGKVSDQVSRIYDDLSEEK